MPQPSSQGRVTEQSLSTPHSSMEASDVRSRFLSTAEDTPFVAIQSVDRNGTVLLWNTASAYLYGIPASDALGKYLPDLLLDKAQEIDFIETIKKLSETGVPTLPRDWKIKTSLGKDLWVFSTMFPDFHDGKVAQIFCIDIDITARKQEEQALLAVGNNLRKLCEKSEDAILLIKDDRFLDANPAALKLFGYMDKSELIGAYPEDLSPPMQPDGETSHDKALEMLALARQNGNHRFEWQHINNCQQTFWAEVLLTEISPDHHPLLYVVIRDISARKATEQSLRLAAQVFENSHEGILIADKDQKIILVNRALTEITGYPEQEVIGKKPQSLYYSMRDPEFVQSIITSIHTNNHWQGELWGRHRNGKIYPFSLSISTVRDSNQEIINYIAIVTDISERRAAEERMQHIAEHDHLTGLPNRILLLDRLQQAMVAARRNNTKLAVMFLNIDRFKAINDSFGHDIADKLLQQVAQRLQQCVSSIDTVSRLGGDEFVIMLVDIGSGEPIAHIAENILNALSAPYSIEACEFNITASIGISIYPDDNDNPNGLIKYADIAMYHAKAKEDNSYQFFDTDMNTRIIERTALDNGLRSALKKNEFILYYQPQMNIDGEHAVGAEALIRWQHPYFGLMMPDRFIRIAEDSGLIVPIGDWVLRTACRQAKSWQDKGTPLVVAVNLSVAQFRQKNFLQSVIEALHAADLEPRYLELEITESVLIDKEQSAIETLQALRELGVKVALDDFGTGFSSLSYLKYIPIDKIKIDQSFVRDIAIDADDVAIIKAIIVMAKGLKLKVIAEGVETREQFQFLESLGCDEYQGFYSCKALPPQQFSEFMDYST